VNIEMGVTLKMKLVAIYASSSDAVDSEFVEAASTLGKLIVEAGYGIIFGGSYVGLMGAIARSIKKNNGYVVGVIPQIIYDKDLHFPDCDELIITQDLRERKAIMEEKAIAFVALPGGFGTIDEISEIITLKQLGMTDYPVVFLNIQNIFGPLFDEYALLMKKKFAKSFSSELYFIADDPNKVMKYILNYKPPKIDSKWFKK
jgi:cytokinin riboside 5'-monophosphate phosphoribohydrolase